VHLKISPKDLDRFLRYFYPDYFHPGQPKVSRIKRGAGRADPVVRSRRCVSAKSTPDGK
jgi:hypothetical protein